MNNPQCKVVIIGAGPAGLTAGYLLAKHQCTTTIIEATEYVGGISRTPQYKGFYFDIGGHRFFSKSEVIEALWEEILPNQMLTRPRKSRIFYRKKFYYYPLKPFNVVFNLGVLESVFSIFSYLKSRIKPRSKVNSFADWIINHFGQRLYLHFFKSYTEKVWGMSCDDISADWAAQRITGLSLLSTIKNALLPTQFLRRKKASIKTLTTTFRYPPRGPGMLWDACAEKFVQMRGNLISSAPVVKCVYRANDKLWEVSYKNKQDELQTIFCEHVISSAPIRDVFTQFLTPKPYAACLQAAQHLRYRDFLIVILILKDRQLFSDNWIYIHDKDVDVARIQNFKSWSPQMVPDPTLCSYGMEYFCNEGDNVWAMSDAALIEKAKIEINKIGLAKIEDIVDGCVVRQPKAYPVYDEHYKENLAIIRKSLMSDYPNLHLVGRNGLHKYNNQDHSMMTALLTVNNILAGKAKYDIWQVNQDAEYHEQKNADAFDVSLGLRDIPERV